MDMATYLLCYFLAYFWYLLTDLLTYLRVRAREHPAQLTHRDPESKRLAAGVTKAVAVTAEPVAKGLRLTLSVAH
jgi:hypothetical protein